MVVPAISDGEKAFIVTGAEKDVRCDGRRQNESRDVEIRCGVIAQAAGSSRVRLGGTDVIVGVKAEIGTPEADTPEIGSLEFSVECSPVASPAFRGRGGEELAAELVGAIEKSYYMGPNSVASESPIDLSSLCILSGKSCWVLYVDALILDLDGSVIDAISMACRAALQDTKIPKVEIQQEGDDADFEVDDDPEQATRLDVSRVPLSLSVALTGTAIIVDPTSAEEEAATVVMSVSTNEEGHVCGISKHRGEGMSANVLLDMIAIAREELKERHTRVKNFLADET
jgi:exosome complex component RRP42